MEDNSMTPVLLSDLGWDEFFDAQFAPCRDEGLAPLRITRENRRQYIALGEAGEVQCEVSGRFRFDSSGKGSFPAVGDWVAASLRPEEKKATIHALLARKSAFLRKVAGPVTEEQVLAANIDTVFIVCGLDQNYNIRRIERYITLALQSGAIPVILLNKADLCPDAQKRKDEVCAIAQGIRVHIVSALQKAGMGIFGEYTGRGRTVAFLGSSGTGKSTIINALLGTERLLVNEVSALGSRGRHTTSFRELIALPGGGMVIDTPGMRELQVWGDEEGLQQAFSDIDELALGCRFKDCSHRSEPGCAVLEAMRSGALDEERLKSFWKLQKEYKYLAQREAMSPAAVEKTRGKKISRLIKDFYRHSSKYNY